MFDIIVGIVLAAFMINGYRKGFFHETLGLVGLLGGVIAGVVAASALSKKADEVLPGFWGAEPFSHLIIFAIFFVSFFFLARFLATILKSLSENLLLGWLNRLVGSGVGLLKGALVVGLALHLVAFMPFGKSFKKAHKNSLFYKPLHEFVPTLYKKLGNPKELPKSVQEIIEDSEELIEDSEKKMDRKMKELDRDRFDGPSRD